MSLPKVPKFVHFTIRLFPNTEKRFSFFVSLWDKQITFRCKKNANYPLKGGVLKNAVRFWYHSVAFIAADFNIRMIIVKVRQYRQGYPLTKINVLAYTFAFLDSKVALKSGVLKNAVRFWYHSVALDPATFE